MRKLNVKTSMNFTKRDSLAVNIYFTELNKCQPLPRAEEDALILKAKAGDKIAEEKVLRANLRFVVSVANQYNHAGDNLGDLISEGNYGLLVAMQRYDPNNGAKFISYAVWWIRQAIILYKSENGTVRRPAYHKTMHGQIREAERGYYSEHGMMPSAYELAELTGFDLRIVEDALTGHTEFSLDAPVNEETDSADMKALIPSGNHKSDQIINQEDKSKAIALAVNQLPEREATIISAYYGLGDYEFPKTLHEIAEILQCSRERVRQLKRAATKRLQRILGDYINN